MFKQSKYTSGIVIAERRKQVIKEKHIHFQFSFPQTFCIHIFNKQDST